MGRVVVLVLFGLLLAPNSSFAQYTQPGHYYGCCYNGGTNRYAAIEDVSIEDQAGNSLYSKAGDGCTSCPNINSTGGHFNLIQPTSGFTLSAGATYTFKMSTSNPIGSTTYNTAGIWFDFNGDQDYADAGEFVSPANWRFQPGNLVSFTFTVPCGGTNGDIRMRVRTDYNTYYWRDVEHSADRLSGGVYYGETEDYVCSYSVPSGLSSDFFVADTSYVGTPVRFVNSNQSGYISHNWTIDGTPATTTNVTRVFNTTGTYTAKLVSENCLGKDSTTKTFVIVAPTAPPVANFVSDKNVVEIFETFSLVDLSSNGPTYWDWSIIKGTDTIDGDDQPNLRGNNPYVNKNPLVNTGNYFGAVDVGTWEICLKATNVIGSSTKFCKTSYITVERTSFNMGPATSLPANIITASGGVIFDKGGENNNYTQPESNLEALIAPCGAQSVTLNFTMFKLLANANLKVYDGVNALGTPLHSGSGFTAGNFPSGSLTANSGAIYLLWNSSPGATDSGFAARWTSVAGTGAAPVADFTIPGNPIYNSVFVDFENTSLNAEGNTTFEWTVTGPVPTYGVSTRNMENQVFTTNGAYTATLKVIGCDGTESTVTKSFTVAAPNSPTELDFTASNRRPAVGDDIVFTATSDKANRWEWSFFPPTGVTAVAPTSDALNERTFKFISAGEYTVQLRGFNTMDTAASEATVVKTAYIIVVDHCIPVIGVTTSTDIGISSVKLTDPNTSDVLLDNQSLTGVAYTDFSDLGTMNLNYGGTYSFEVKRASNVNNMSRKIWIDWNVDGDFTDAGEMVASESTGNSMTWTGTFPVPASAFQATTLMRVGVSYDNDLNLPCGANSNPNANRVGEFEDYSIQVVNDGDLPTITLIGADTVYVEQNAAPAYSTQSATANDPSQGDITADLVMTSDLDQTLPGIYYEVYNVADASGNPAAEVTRVIYVVSDQTAPVITVNGSADTTIEVGTPWLDLGASALDNKEGDLTNAIVTTGVVDFNVLGDYIITYAAQDNQGNASSAIRTVRVVDTELPVIENPSADKSSACWVVEVQLQNIFADITSATDNYNDLTNGLTFTANPASPQGGAAVDTRFQGTTSVIYTATDESGNIATQCIDYVVKDYIAPDIDLRTLDVINHRVNTPYTPVAATASDNLYSSSQISLTTTSNVDAFVLGVYQDTYTATDAAGNVSTKVRTVNVIDDLNPKITGKSGGVIKLGVGSQVDVINYINFSDNYDSPTDLRNNHTLIYNSVNLQEAGLYTAVFQTTDNSGNESDEYTLYVDVSHDYAVKTNSVEDLSLEDMLSVAPNPTTGIVNINVNLPENEVINIAIYNTMGQEVVNVKNGKISNGTYTVSLDNQTNGIYYVRMSLKGSIVTKKVILNK